MRGDFQNDKKIYTSFRHTHYLGNKRMLDVQIFKQTPFTAQKMKFSVMSVKNFSKFDLIRSFLQIWSHLLKKSLMENFIFYAVLFCKICP